VPSLATVVLIWAHVRPVRDADGVETGTFEIPAGGRRFQALSLLVKQKRLAKIAPIHCIVREATSDMPHADLAARAIDLDMVEAGWEPTVDGYLNRVPKARILEAVREAKGEGTAQLLDHLKKGEMAPRPSGCSRAAAVCPRSCAALIWSHGTAGKSQKGRGRNLADNAKKLGIPVVKFQKMRESLVHSRSNGGGE
jgi:hypothetical protein